MGQSVKQCVPAPPPRTLASELPPDLEQLCQALLERDPQTRLAGLGRLRGDLVDPDLGQSPEPPTPARPPHRSGFAPPGPLDAWHLGAQWEKKIQAHRAKEALTNPAEFKTTAHRYFEVIGSDEGLMH